MALLAPCVFLVMAISCFFVQKPSQKCGPIYLTIAAKEPFLQINWRFTCQNHPDTLVLLERTSKIKYIEVDRISGILEMQGFKRTNKTFVIKSYPGGWNIKDKNPKPGRHCFPYEVIAIMKGVVVDIQCLAIEPTWMSRFGSLQIGQMFIPGTHNSGASKCHFVDRLVVTQDLDFWGQLVSGIRYFDIRVGFHTVFKQFYIYHNFVPCIPLMPEMKKVAKFLKRSKHEIVVLDFYKLQHLSNAEHKHLLTLLKRTFGKLLSSPGKFFQQNGATLKEMWKINQRVIINYKNEIQRKGHKWLWHEVHRKWGNKNTAESLQKYIKSVAQSHSHKRSMCVLMAEITPTAFQLLVNSFRDFADMVNPYLSKWLYDNDLARNVNIVAVDFFFGTNVVGDAIRENVKKLS